MEPVLIVLVGAIVGVLLVGIGILFLDEERKDRKLRMWRAMGIERTHAPSRPDVASPHKPDSEHGVLTRS